MHMLVCTHGELLKLTYVCPEPWRLPCTTSVLMMHAVHATCALLLSRRRRKSLTLHSACFGITPAPPQAWHPHRHDVSAEAAAQAAAADWQARVGGRGSARAQPLRRRQRGGNLRALSRRLPTTTARKTTPRLKSMRMQPSPATIGVAQSAGKWFIGLGHGSARAVRGRQGCQSCR